MLKKSILAVLTLLMLTACSNKDEELTAEERQKVIDDGTVGFESADGIITKAENIPADEEKAILAAFDEYIAAFNAKELERYMQTISKNPEGFKFDEEKEYTKKAFEQYDVKREVKDTIITKYRENEAQVHTNLTTRLLQIGTNIQHDNVGEQITVFVKEDGDWKVTSTFYIGDDSKSSTSE